MRLRRTTLAEVPPGLTNRSAVPDRNVREAATAICENVRSGGDAVVGALASKYGGGFRRVDQTELETALRETTSELRLTMEAAITAVGTFHAAQLPKDLHVSTAPGVDITRRWTPLGRIGAYVPGGNAAYPSTVIMTVIPAKVAGVAEIVVASPEKPDGTVDTALLAACLLAGATEVWAMGGAQAIGALAHGTESLQPVQKIVGPGNAWVTAAKLAVYGDCAIDLPAGPSEVLVLADHSADPRLVAIDLLCQAEHGPDSPAILVTDDITLPDRVETELEGLLPRLERGVILEKALGDHGWSVLVPDINSGIAFANEYAAEHVTIMTADPELAAKAITAAGSVYIGRWSPESAGDYATGANHVLPTGGLAAACGPLSVEDFGSWRQEQRLTERGLSSIVGTISGLADAEGLTAHKLAAQLRFERQSA